MRLLIASDLHGSLDSLRFLCDTAQRLSPDMLVLLGDLVYHGPRNPLPGGYFFVGSGLFWGIVIALFVLAFILWASLRTFARRRADVVGTRNRKASKMALRRLKLADTFLKQNLYTAFYEELHKALTGFVCDKLNIPMADLSKDWE